MISEKRDAAGDASSGAAGERMETSSREGDVRKRDQQDARTAGSERRDVAKDDPSRAPESGTP
ncbi:MAG TPA: hypothetical protein VFE72_01300 [Lysobacter sp.]|nr:hypothetical protein [Lysobacter sp.]